jgi:hypothetical protein
MVKDWVIGILALGALIGLIIWAGAFNGDQAEACEKHGMVWVKEAPFGDYGCAEQVIPVEEIRG